MRPCVAAGRGDALTPAVRDAGKGVAGGLVWAGLGRSFVASRCCVFASLPGPAAVGVRSGWDRSGG